MTVSYLTTRPTSGPPYTTSVDVTKRRSNWLADPPLRAETASRISRGPRPHQVGDAAGTRQFEFLVHRTRAGAGRPNGPPYTFINLLEPFQNQWNGWGDAGAQP